MVPARQGAPAHPSASAARTTIPPPRHMLLPTIAATGRRAEWRTRASVVAVSVERQRRCGSARRRRPLVAQPLEHPLQRQHVDGLDQVLIEARLPRALPVTVLAVAGD